MQLPGIPREGMEHAGQRGDECGLLAAARDQIKDAENRRVRTNYQNGRDGSQQGHWVCLHVRAKESRGTEASLSSVPQRSKHIRTHYQLNESLHQHARLEDCHG